MAHLFSADNGSMVNDMILFNKILKNNDSWCAYS